MNEEQIDKLDKALSRRHNLHWENTVSGGWRKLSHVEREYIDRDDGPITVVWLEDGTYFRAAETEPDEIVVMKQSKFF